MTERLVKCTQSHKLILYAFHFLFNFLLISITVRNFWTTPILWKLLPQSRMVCPRNVRGAASNYVIGED